MGNNNTSHLKYKRSSKIISEFNQIESEQERQDTLYNIDSIDSFHTYHFLKKHIFQNNFSSPIEDKLIEGGYKVLDVGCGPGTWLLDLSNEYENSSFFGVNDKPLFPQQIKPNNLKFIEADIINGLTFQDNEFDFTHLENISLVFTPDQWDLIIPELIRVTKPGGYIEVTGRLRGHVDNGPILRKVSDALCSIYSEQNIDTNLMHDLDSKFELQPNIGKVHRTEKELIVGPNGGKVGLVVQDIGISYFTSEMAIKNLSEEIGISEVEFKNMIEKDLIEEFKQTNPVVFHFRIWAQKQLSQ